MKRIYLDELEYEELLEGLRKVLQCELQSFVNKSGHEDEDDDLLTRKDAAALLKVSLPTLHDWVKSGIIPAYRIGSNIRFKKSELIKSLIKIKSLSK